jgi:two-component system cell cycle sensor histidine kinase/response regulator CckA
MTISAYATLRPPTEPSTVPGLADEAVCHAALQAMDDAVLLLEADPHLRVVMANERMAQLLGVTAMALCGQPFATLAGFDAARLAVLEESLRRCDRVREVVQILVAGRQPIWLELQASAMPERDGPCRRWLLVGRDVGERLAVEAILAEQNKMEAIVRLAGGVAHEFNNLLTIIGGYGEMLAATLPSQHRDDVTEICKAAERAAGLTAQLMAFARTQVVQPRSVDLSSTIAEMEPALQELAGRDVDLQVRLGDVGPVWMDPRQVEQILVALAVHARDEMPEGGQMSLCTRNVHLAAWQVAAHPGLHPGQYVELVIADTGPGLTASERARLFEPFFRVRHRGVGFGMGLATAYGVVLQAGGRVMVESTPGQGTRFRILLPLGNQALASAAPREQATRGGHETVLLVEDEAVVRRLARDILQRHGYHVLEAADGPAALAVVDQYPGRIDLLVTDVVMPRMSGPELVDHVAPRRPATRVLFLSGYTDHALLDRGALKQGVAFVQKPFSAEGLTQHVRQVLDAATL